MIFVDSYWFMLAQLAKIVNIVSEEKFFLLDNYLEKLWPHHWNSQYVETERALPLLIFHVNRKISWNLPSPASNVENKLTGGDVGISWSEYNHALKVFTKLKRGSLGDYHDLWLMCFYLLPFSKLFVKFAIKHKGWIAPVTSRQANFWKFVSPNWWTSGSCAANDTRRHVVGLIALMLQSKQKDPDKILPSEPSSYILNFDANNLYGGIIKHSPLPLKDFSIFCLEDILLTSETSEWGYWIEVSVIIPEECHDFFAD